MYSEIKDVRLRIVEDYEGKFSIEKFESGGKKRTWYGYVEFKWNDHWSAIIYDHIWDTNTGRYHYELRTFKTKQEAIEVLTKLKVYPKFTEL